VRNHHIFNFLRQISGFEYTGYKRKSIIRKLNVIVVEPKMKFKNPRVIYRIDYDRDESFDRKVDSLLNLVEKLKDTKNEKEKENILINRKTNKLKKKILKSTWGHHDSKKKDIEKLESEVILNDIKPLNDKLGKCNKKIINYNSRVSADLMNYNVIDDIAINKNRKTFLNEFEKIRIVNRTRFKGVKRKNKADYNIPAKTRRFFESESHNLEVEKAIAGFRELKKSISEGIYPGFDVNNKRDVKRHQLASERVLKRINKFVSSNLDWSYFIYFFDLREDEVKSFYLRKFIGDYYWNLIGETNATNFKTKWKDFKF
jgi:hypothetical protein